MPMTDSLEDLDAAAELILQRIPGPLRIGAPLAIAKPHRLLDHSRAVTGTLFFVPSATFLEEVAG